MKTNKSRVRVVTKTAEDLAAALGLRAEDGVEIEVRAKLNDEIVRIVAKKGLTHAAVAKAASTSRTRVTAILNRDLHEVSTDLLLRIVGALGYRADVTVRQARPAA